MEILKTRIYPVLNPYLPRTNPYLKYGFFAQVPDSNSSGFFNSDEVICKIQDPENVLSSLARAALICYDCILCYFSSHVTYNIRTTHFLSIASWPIVPIGWFHCG